MQLLYHNIPVDNGDCHFIRLIDGEDQYVIMVDCGSFNNPVQTYIESECRKHIDILVITHIDDDHIKGVITMLNKYKDDDAFQIDKIWFNSYQSTGEEETRKLTPEETEVILRLKSDLKHKLKPYTGEISTNQSMTLAETILSLPKYEKAWNLRAITTSTPVQRLGRWGKISFVSPSPERLKDLMKDYAKWIYEHLYRKLGANEKYEGSENIFEILVRYADVNKHILSEGQVSAAETLTEYLLREKSKPSRLDDSPTNGSSIAFVWKKGRHRILMLGDAWADEVTRGLLKAFSKGRYPLLFDFVKVSHHASAANTTSTLLDHIESMDWFISGYTNSKKEHLKTVSRIILQPFISNRVNMRNLHFNCKTDDYKTLSEADEALKNSLHFSTDNQTDYEI